MTRHLWARPIGMVCCHLSLMGIPAAQASTINAFYVDPDFTGAGDGSAAKPWTSLGYASTTPQWTCANQAIGAVVCTTGDINQVSQCNVIDVQRVVNAALGGGCNP